MTGVKVWLVTGFDDALECSACFYGVFQSKEGAEKKAVEVPFGSVSEIEVLP